MSTNRQTLDNLFRSGGINLQRGPIFDTAPEPLPQDFDFAKVEGMMLGLVIGEALGMTTERWLPAKRRAVHGEIRDYLPNRYGDAPVGLTSDDMQLAFSTLEQMLAHDGFYPAQMADHYCHHHIFGRGFTVRQFIRNHQSGLPWYQCGPKSARNGALVRIAPMVIPHLKSATTDLWVDTALSAMLTHNEAGSTAACLALVNMLWRLFGMNTLPEPNWWLETYLEVAKDLEGETRHRARGGKFLGYEGPIWRFVEENVSRAHEADLSTLDACNQWHSGVFLLETVPSVIYILMRHADDPEQAIVRAVNDTKDNDTIAAVVGAAIGALHGNAEIPARWISDLPGRIDQQDQGKIFSLLEAARKRWWS